MSVDYTKLFATPDELADFLLQDVAIQDEVVAKYHLAADGGPREMRCTIKRAVTELS